MPWLPDISLDAQWTGAGLIEGGTQQRRLSRILTWFPFHPGPQPQAPNLAAKILQNAHTCSEINKKTPVRIAAGRSLNKQINYGK